MRQPNRDWAQKNHLAKLVVKHSVLKQSLPNSQHKPFYTSQYEAYIEAAQNLVSGCPAMHAQPPIHPRTRAGRPGEGAQWFQRPLGSEKSQKDPENLVMSLAYQGAVHGLPGYCRLKTTP